MGAEHPQSLPVVLLLTLMCFVCLPLRSSHGAFAVQVRRRRAEEAAEPEQVPSEREAVAQRRRGKMGQMCCEYKKSVYSEQLEQERFAKK